MVAEKGVDGQCMTNIAHAWDAVQRVCRAFRVFAYRHNTGVLLTKTRQVFQERRLVKLLLNASNVRA